VSNNTRVLLIEDNKFDRELVKYALQSSDATFQVIDACSAREFEAHLENSQFDVVLTDFNILGFGGLVVVNSVRKKFPDIPVIVITGTGSEQIAVESLKSGANDYIVKTPQHIRRLPYAIAAALEKMRLDQEARKSEQEIRELNEKLQEKVSERTAELEAFTSSVSHDLRAPLRRIYGFCYALKEECDDQLNEPGRDFLSRIIKSVDHMRLLIDGLIDLSKAMDKEMIYVSVDLSYIAHEIMNELKNDDPDRQVEITIVKDAKTHGEHKLLRVALTNLLQNAWKYTRPNNKPHIEFGILETTKDWVSYFVRDNGIGFDMQHKDEIFEVFKRLHTEDEFPGDGIGLATVKQIITRHRGKIWTNAIKDEGATFYFRLPTYHNAKDFHASNNSTDR